MQGNHDQDSISTHKTGGLISRILFILKPSIGKETSQLVREEPMIDNDSHERGDRIRNKITSIIRDRTPPVTSKMTDAYEEYGQQKVEDTFVSTNRSSLDRLEPPVSSDSQFHQEEFNEEVSKSPRNLSKNSILDTQWIASICQN